MLRVGLALSAVKLHIIEGDPYMPKAARREQLSEFAFLAHWLLL
jgi:hypothetical protein